MVARSVERDGRPPRTGRSRSVTASSVTVIPEDLSAPGASAELAGSSTSGLSRSTRW